MDEKYLTIKIVLTKLGEGQFRSRIEQSPLGASKGPGFDFTIDEDGWNEINGFIKKMPTCDLGHNEVKTLGKKLFKLILDGEVLSKYKDCLVVARNATPKSRLRLAITILAEQLLTVPWEYLHDGASFLIKQSHTIIRVIDELAEKKAPYWPIQRLLVAIANPGSADPANAFFPPFDAPAHREAIEKRLASLAGLQYEVLMPATRRELETRIRDQKFDALYFVGHGTFTPDAEGQLILEDGKNKHDPLDASELSEWLTNPSGDQRIRFVYLNSCSTSKTDASNAFAGVAQRLMRDGDIDAAVAMQTNVQQTAALEIAIGFFDELIRGNTPEQALRLARGKASDAHSWGIPVIYSSLGGSEELNRNKIAHFLSAEIGKSTYGFILPNFRLGVPVEEVSKKKYALTPKTKYFYPGDTLSLKDSEAAWDVMRLLSQVVSPDEIQLLAGPDHKDTNFSHRFLFGSKSNKIVARVLKSYSPRFQFHYELKGRPGQWMLLDTETKLEYLIKDPHKGKPEAYAESEDFGVIEKIARGKKVFFLLSGLGDRATRGCGWYFYEHWKDLFQEFGSKTFGIILRFPPGLEYTDAERISRQTGKPYEPDNSPRLV